LSGDGIGFLSKSGQRGALIIVLATVRPLNKCRQDSGNFGVRRLVVEGKALTSQRTPKSNLDPAKEECDLFKRDIIVISGSAGALEALIAIVGKLPHDLPASIFIVFSHLAHARASERIVLVPRAPARGSDTQP